MPALSNGTLFAKLRAALPQETRFETPGDAVHPAVAVIPGFGRVRFYLWTVTPDRSAPGARPPGEFKIQLIVTGQTRGARGSLQLDDAYTVLLGFSPEFGVFVGWEARLYRNFGFSANVQVREDLLTHARRTGWAIAAPRQSQGDEEVRIAFTPGNLPHFLRVSRRADSENLHGTWREAFLLSNTPNARPEPLPTRERDVQHYTERQRETLISARLSRDARFAPRVKEQFGYACAVCNVQLEIVEAAHILPVCEPGSSDDIWNGIALCPNHHTLFDSSVFVVDRGLLVRVHHPTIEFLRESERADGLELVTDFEGDRIREPLFWSGDADRRRRMETALDRRVALAASA